MISRFSLNRVPSVLIRRYQHAIEMRHDRGEQPRRTPSRGQNCLWQPKECVGFHIKLATLRESRVVSRCNFVIFSHFLALLLLILAPAFYLTPGFVVQVEHKVSQKWMQLIAISSNILPETQFAPPIVDKYFLYPR